MEIHGPLIIFPPGSDDGELFPAASSQWMESEPLIFERTILAAAFSDSPSPPLPDDELLG